MTQIHLCLNLMRVTGTWKHSFSFCVAILLVKIALDILSFNSWFWNIDRIWWDCLLVITGLLICLKLKSFPNGIFQRTRTNNFTICMEIQKTSNSQSNLEKEDWNWRDQPAWLQTILKSYSHQESMVLAQSQKYRSMKQNRKPRDKSTHLWTSYLWQRRQEYTMD